MSSIIEIQNNNMSSCEAKRFAADLVEKTAIRIANLVADFGKNNCDSQLVREIIAEFCLQDFSGETETYKDLEVCPDRMARRICRILKKRAKFVVENAEKRDNGEIDAFVVVIFRRLEIGVVFEPVNAENIYLVSVSPRGNLNMPAQPYEYFFK